MLEAGRELDVLVAKHVIGLDCYGVELYQHDEFCELHNPPRYSTDMAAAWEVAERVGWKLLPMAIDLRDGQWCIWDCPNDHGEYPANIVADTFPLAICLVALKAVGYEPKESA